MKLHPGLPALTLLGLLLPACAQILQAAAPPVTHDPTKTAAGPYVVEPGHTQILFSVLHLGFTHYYGTFSGASGLLAYAPDQPRIMSVSVTVPVASVATTSPKLDGELKSADWLDAGRYPTMVFRSNQVTQTGPTEADIAGTLTLHGVTRPLTLHATFVGAGVNLLDNKQTLGFQLAGVLKRSDFGVARFVPLVSDEVTLTIAAAFEKAG